MPLDPPERLPAVTPAMQPKAAFQQRFKPSVVLPPLAPVRQISRPPSTPEYYHASVGTSGRTLEVTRENGFCYEAEGRLSAEQWQRALDAVTLVNPGTRLRLVGSGRKARWESDGLPPQLRVVEGSTWEGRGTTGSDFLYDLPFPLDTGPTVELVVIHQSGNRSLLVLRNHHAVMDGMGCMHFMQELFRALRGEPLLGTNAAFSEVDLMRSVGAKKSISKHVKTLSMMGLPQGDERGDEWRRLSLGRPKKNQLARIADAVADFARQHTDLQLSIGVPVDLRRHAPGLNSTANFTNMILVTLNPGEGGEVFRTRLKEMLDHKMETVYPGILDLFKWFSLARMDLMLSRKEGNYRTKKALETAVISNLGRHEAAPYSCEGFVVQRFFVIPIKGSIFFGMSCMNDEVELTLNLPRVLGSHGRFEAFEAHLLKRMQD